LGDNLKTEKAVEKYYFGVDGVEILRPIGE
jgi:hypothetical protein